MRKKTPQEKKALSYAKDRRNAYGESRARSRFSIKKKKTLPNRTYRRLTARVLNFEIDSNEETLEFVDSEVKAIKRKKWKKCPDVSLKDWVQGRFEYRERMFRARLKRQNKIEAE